MAQPQVTLDDIYAEDDPYRLVELLEQYDPELDEMERLMWEEYLAEEDEEILSALEG